MAAVRFIWFSRVDDWVRAVDGLTLTEKRGAGEERPSAAGSICLMADPFMRGSAGPMKGNRKAVESIGAFTVAGVQFA